MESMDMIVRSNLWLWSFKTVSGCDQGRVQHRRLAKAQDVPSLQAS